MSPYRGAALLLEVQARMKFYGPVRKGSRLPAVMAGLLPLGLLAGALVLPAGAADWPQWRGPLRNGVSAETGWQSRWPAGGPRRLWSARVGQGFSAVAVRRGHLFTSGNSGNQDTILCLNAETGQPVWRYSYPCGAGDYEGTRATPVLDGDRLYTMSREAQVFCLNAATGQPVWSKDLKRELRLEEPRWGFAGSPLVEGNLVILNVGTAGAALDRATGRVVWRSGSGVSGYASPVSYVLGPQRGVALFTAGGLVGVAPATGRQLWQFPWDTDYEVNAADPVFAGNQVFISSNYNKGCALLRLGGSRPTVVWQNRDMRNHFNSSVLVDGHLYGNDQNTLKCLDLRTGAQRWQQRGLGKGGLIAADGKLIVLTERGELKVVAATPRAYTELASAKVMGGKCWTHPVLANGRIYCRSHEGELICLDVRAAR